ncbi:isochorismate synthase [Baaleninema sp.]
MNFIKPVKEAGKYVSEAFLRIFSPTDDHYPKVGVQPFEGRPSKKSA